MYHKDNYAKTAQNKSDAVRLTEVGWESNKKILISSDLHGK